MSVSRLDCNLSVSNQYWNFEQDTTPNGTIDLASRSSHVPGSGRVLILFYAADTNTAVTGSMTIGGVAPTWEYANTYDLAVDMQSYVGIWSDADIEAMTGSTAATNGTWPSTTLEVWGYNMYMNVDQQNPLLNGPSYVEHGSIASPSQFSVATGGKPDDLILILGLCNVSAGNIASQDTLYKNVDTDDGVGNNMRYYVLEGPTGDTSTQIGPNGTGSHATYGLVLNYRRYAMRIECRDYRVNTTEAGSVFASTRVPDLEVSANQTTPSREYLSVTQCHHLGNTSASAFFDINTYQNGIGRTAANETTNREPRRTGTNTGHQHFAFERKTMAGTGSYPNNRDFRASGRADGTNIGRVSATDMMLIDLSDLIEGQDFESNEDATSYTALDNTAWDEGATVTLGSPGDWLIFAYAHILVDSTTSAIRLKITVNDTDNGGMIELEGEDVAEEYCHGFIMPIAALGAGDVIKLEFQTDNATAGHMDINANAIFALRLNSFEDHFMEYDPTDTPITTVDVDETVASFAHTNRLNQDTDYVVGCMFIQDIANSASRSSCRMEEATDGIVAGGLDESVCQNGTFDLVPTGPHWQMYTGQADGGSKTFNVIANEEEGGITLGTITDTWAWGFTPVFARSGPHEIFYGKRENTLLRM